MFSEVAISRVVSHIHNIFNKKVQGRYGKIISYIVTNISTPAPFSSLEKIDEEQK